MIVLLLGVFIFLSVHSISIVKPEWRKNMVARLGVGRWKGFYSTIAGIGLVLIFIGYAEARQQPHFLYTSPAWLRHLALLVLLPVFPLIFSAYLPGRIQSACRHPMLLATLMWSCAHLMVNGAIADLVLFGSFFVWAGCDLISLRNRVSNPVPQISLGHNNDLIAVTAGLLSYFVVVFWVHFWVIGVKPIP